ncbi:MAG: metallophosphoesterase [Bacteroidota bacterium]
MNDINPNIPFDFIGDIHGHATELKALLDQLGYTLQNGSYAHPSRKAFFVGDYIDRGPQIRETLQIVKSMVESNNAIAIMGNHEYNALCYHTRDHAGGHLRPHNSVHVQQHAQTIEQFKNHPAEWEGWLQWFTTLPLFYETEQFRAVHACWDDHHISYLKSILPNNCITGDLLAASVQEDSPFYNAIEATLKGKEMNLPGEMTFKDKDGHIRKEIRIRWWEDPAACTYRNISVHLMPDLPETAIDHSLFKHAHFYAATDKPVFFGHYWLQGNPMLFKNNICCLDYSVAKQGKLVAYRFDNEKELDDSKIVYV